MRFYESFVIPYPASDCSLIFDYDIVFIFESITEIMHKFLSFDWCDIKFIIVEQFAYKFRVPGALALPVDVIWSKVDVNRWKSLGADIKLLVKVIEDLLKRVTFF